MSDNLEDLDNFGRETVPTVVKQQEQSRYETITAEQLRKAMPHSVRNSVNADIVKKINNFIAEGNGEDDYATNVLGFCSVLSQGKFPIQRYVEAVKFVSYKLLGSSNISAYVKTFPVRYKNMLEKGWAEKDISSLVAGFAKNKLVGLIYAQTLTPSYIFNQDLYQKALNTSADLMMNAKSEKVRADAANNIMNQLKMPETAKVELDIRVNEDGAIDALKESTMALVEQQRKAMQLGLMDAKSVAESTVVAEVNHIEEVEGKRLN